jgi:RNA polymerase primary sigma factor
MIEELTRVTELVRATPGLTAVEVRDALRRDGRVSITTADVLRTLTSVPCVFRHQPGQDGWWYAPSDPQPPSVTGAEPRLPPLYRWQNAALSAWRAASCRGVIEAVTGTGKTVVGLIAARDELARGGQVVVLVPTRELLTQWRAAAQAALPRGTSIGLLGDGHSDGLGHHDLVIAVVNSAREADLSPRRRGGLLIADECHRYASNENRRALAEPFPYRLGLSATFARPDDGHLAWLAPYFGETCYRLGYEEARRDGVIAPFDVVLVRLECSVDERAIYDEQTETLQPRELS